jgi:hypothetical protein
MPVLACCGARAPQVENDINALERGSMVLVVQE